MQVSASGFSQVSLAEKNVPLRSVFKKIQKQTGFDFLYGSQLLQEAGNVSIDVSNVTLENALDLCFKGKPLSYTIIEKTIVVKPKPLVIADVKTVAELKEIISGKITDEQGLPLAGASVYIKGSSKATVTDAQGRFNLEVDNLEGTLLV